MSAPCFGTPRTRRRHGGASDEPRAGPGVHAGQQALAHGLAHADELAHQELCENDGEEAVGHLVGPALRVAFPLTARVLHGERERALGGRAPALDREPEIGLRSEQEGIRQLGEGEGYAAVTKTTSWRRARGRAVAALHALLRTLDEHVQQLGDEETGELELDVRAPVVPLRGRGGTVSTRGSGQQ